MKLGVNRSKDGLIRYYTITINKAEAEAAGLINEHGESLNIDKVVDCKKNRIIIELSDGRARHAIPSTFIYENIDILKSGKRATTSRKDHYIMEGSILFKQNHQSYLRGESPTPYGELIDGVFYEILPDEQT